MPVPDFQSLMLPVLKATAGRVVSSAELREKVASATKLTQRDLEELLPSGRQTVFANRVAWANVFLQRAGLIERIKREQYHITREGQATLATTPSRIDLTYLTRYPSYREWRAASQRASEPSIDSARLATEFGAQTPEEIIEQTHELLTKQLAADLLDRLREATPALFERIVVVLLTAMGYGGGREEMSEALGRSGDGGIDGIIKEDSLGLDVVYMQAKRYVANTVGEPEIRDFVGALVGRRASKGVFVTTSSFTKSAREYVERVPNRIVLIDGVQLASFMVAHGVGVRVRVSYELKTIDDEFFTDELT